MRPDRIIVGADDERAILLMRALYAPFTAQPRPADGDGRALGRADEVRRQRDAGHAHLLHERAGAPGRRAGRGHRAGAPGHRHRCAHRHHFLYAGCGYGGSCFPKDVHGADPHRRREPGTRLPVLRAVEAVNERQKHVLVEKIAARASAATCTAARFAIWGLAFKPNTDDMREAPSRVLIEAAARARRHACAPTTRWPCQRPGACWPTSRPQLRRPGDATRSSGADALVIVTEWKEFRSPDFDRIKAHAAPAGDLRRAQHVRAGVAASRRHRIPRHRPPDRGGPFRAQHNVGHRTRAAARVSVAAICLQP